MKTIYEALLTHRSIRKYRSTPVPDDLLEKILHAGTRASSSGNMQPYSIIVTRSSHLKKRLLAPHFHQEMVTEAPVLLTFCSDFYRMRRWLEINQAPENFDNLMSFLIGMIDATLASQNVAIAAEAEGLGICYMGTTLASNGEIAKILELPQYVVPVVGFSLGYPAESPEIRDRLPLNRIVHQETYQDYKDADIERIYCQKESSGFDRYMKVTDLRKKVIEAGAKNLAQIYTKVKYTKESHIRYSLDVLNCLQDQGFLNHIENRIDSGDMGVSNKLFS